MENAWEEKKERKKTVLSCLYCSYRGEIDRDPERTDFFKQTTFNSISLTLPLLSSC